jgi:hypothetical protein
MEPGDGAGTNEARRELWISAFAGRTELESYLRAFGADDRPELIDEALERWDEQRKRLDELVAREAGSPIVLSIEPVPDEYVPLLDAYATEDAFKQAFPDAEWEYGLVELDGLVPLRKHVNLEYADQLVTSYGAPPTLEALIQICLSPTKHPEPLEHALVSPDVYEFRSERPDLRLLGSAVRRIDPSDVRAASAGLPVIGVLAFVGFGPLVVSAAPVGDRLALLDGLHRAYALRAVGVKKIPVVVRRDQAVVNALQDDRVEFSLDELQTMERPPLLRDFFDPELSMTFRIKPQRKALTLRLEVGERSLSS